MDSIQSNAATIVLRYVGNGAFVNGVPARDLTQTDIEQCGHSVEQLLAFEPRVYDDASSRIELLDSRVRDDASERTDAPLAESSVAVVNLKDGVSEQEAHIAGRALRQRRKENEA